MNPKERMGSPFKCNCTLENDCKRDFGGSIFTASQSLPDQISFTDNPRDRVRHYFGTEHTTWGLRRPCPVYCLSYPRMRQRCYSQGSLGCRLMLCVQRIQCTPELPGHFKHLFWSLRYTDLNEPWRENLYLVLIGWLWDEENSGHDVKIAFLFVICGWKYYLNANHWGIYYNHGYDSNVILKASCWMNILPPRWNASVRLAQAVSPQNTARRESALILN